jgi:DnaK suppressor protein
VRVPAPALTPTRADGPEPNEAAAAAARPQPRSPHSTPAHAGAAAVPDTVGEPEKWTRGEMAELRSELLADVERLRSEIDAARHERESLLIDYGDGAGEDQADAGTKTFEREHEMSLANNALDMLQQDERALSRLEDGSYGQCESCGRLIGKARLQAFPRATLCMTCKQWEERR